MRTSGIRIVGFWPILVVFVASCPVFADPPAPLVIGTRACLFFDDHYVAEQSGLKRIWHQGKPDANVVTKSWGTTWESWPHLYGSVLRDPKDGLYKMYYTASNYPSVNPPTSFSSYICYAESKDGKTWTKPTLGLHEESGSKNNNIVIRFAELPNVFVDPREKDPDKRLKMFVYLMHQNPYEGIGECLLASGDGIHWTFIGGYNKPTYADPADANYTDSHVFTYDALGDRYLSYVRTWHKAAIAEAKDNRRRAVGISQSQEINKDWTPIQHVLAADEHDDAAAASKSKEPDKPDWGELYCMHFFDYGNQYIGLLSVFHLLDAVDRGSGGDLQFTFSHDGLKWFRPDPRERITIIGPSDAAPRLFPAYATTNAPLELGDELWLYYSESNGAHPVTPFKESFSQIRAAVWRKDGFVSLDAAETGTLKTPPLRIDGNKLVLNTRCGDGGSVKVTILDADGKPIPGFDATTCDALTGDQVRGVVAWGGKLDLTSLKGKTVSLQLDLKQCSLFSFRVSE